MQKQGSVISLLKAQFTTFKAIVLKPTFGEYEKSAEIVSEKFDKFGLQLDDSDRYSFAVGKEGSQSKICTFI